MSEYSRFLSWMGRCHDRPGYGMTPGDTAYLGLRDYVEPYPCPNGLPIDTREPGECESWQKRIEKARRDIDWHRREFAAAEIVFSEDDVFDLITIAKGFDE
jgi:hypothetical protein